MDELKERIQRGRRAEKILRDEDICTALNELQETITEMWVTSKSDQMDKREELYREIHGLRALQARLRGYIDQGKLAERSLEQ